MIKNKKIFGIGFCGFIGSHLVDKLVEQGHTITIYDNLSAGKREFIEQHLKSWKANLIVNDVLKFDNLKCAMQGHDIIFHLSANPDARFGLDNTRLDLEQGTIAAYNVLEAARLNGIKEIVFSSSGTMYGNTPVHCKEEDLGNLPISLYGASKMAGEALISAYVECFDFKATILRFGNVIGPRATHGVIFDLCKKLKEHPDYIDVLGDGTQSKPYVYISDIVDGVLFARENNPDQLEIYNIAPPDATSVKQIAEMVVANSPYPNAEIRYGKGNQGWKGDVPTSRLNASKINKLGFSLNYTSNQAVERAIKEVVKEVF